MPFKFNKLEIPDVVCVEPEVFYDQRGYFSETYKSDEFKQSGISEEFIQDCHSQSLKKGTLRGLHYQKHPMAQGKLVRVTKGEIFDVAVDIRKGSPYYGKWLSVILSCENKKMLYVPAGFAHGFCTLADGSEVLYKYTNLYSPQNYGGIIWDDSSLAINWPVKNPIISAKDASLPVLEKADNNFIYSARFERSK